MTDGSKQKLDEEKLKHLADSGVEVEMPRDGHPLPEGFVNPPPGVSGHRCVDIRGGKIGTYHKDWFSLMLHKSDHMPQRQTFNAAGKKYSILVGQWVDVPPEIIEVLSMAVVRQVRHGFDISDPLGVGETTQTVSEVPRFSYSVMPSA